jgi:hypothetical protein
LSYSDLFLLLLQALAAHVLHKAQTMWHTNELKAVAVILQAKKQFIQEMALLIEADPLFSGY